jgi:glycosyltransferase involved in cell wall biosynthesis
MTKISILLPVYNDENYITDAISSVLNNSYKDFELVIINDGSNDKTLEKIHEFNDSRIKLFSKPNTGLIDSLNYGIDKCQYDIIMRMDGDDVIHPDKIKIQLKEFINSDLILLGTSGVVINNLNKVVSKVKLPKQHEAIITAQLKLLPSIIHPSIMVYKEALIKVGKYDSKIEVAEDYDLFLRLSKIGKIGNINSFLYYIRKNTDNVSFTRSSDQLINTLISRRYFLEFKSEKKMSSNYYDKNRLLIDSSSLFKKIQNNTYLLNREKLKFHSQQYLVLPKILFYMIKRYLYSIKLLNNY